MTKLHEEFIRGTVSQILETIKARPIVKGECTLLVAGSDRTRKPEIEKVQTALKTALENETGSLSEIARMVAQKYDLPKKKVYDLALQVRGQKSKKKGQ